MALQESGLVSTTTSGAKARKEVAALLKAFPGIADLWFRQHRLFEREGRTHDAWRSLDRARQLAPEEPGFEAASLWIAPRVLSPEEVAARYQSVLATIRQPPAEVCLFYALGQALTKPARESAEARRERAARVRRAAIEGLARQGTRDRVRRYLRALEFLADTIIAGCSPSEADPKGPGSSPRAVRAGLAVAWGCKASLQKRIPHAHTRKSRHPQEVPEYAAHAMPRHFNTAGPCDPVDHYMLPPEQRLPGVRGLVDQKAYFVLHAPRQVGKTTALLSLAKALSAEGRYAALLVSMETGAAFPEDVGAAELAILAEWRIAAKHQLPAELQPPPWPEAAPGARIGAALEAWASASARPLVLFLDEIDALRDQVLISVLRQLRAGHKYRPKGFPWALGLVGLRDVRDYKVAVGDSEELHTASPFNIKVRSLTMREFTADEVAALYAQHTADTGQRFDPGAYTQAFALTQGQPWLVNALAYVATEELKIDRGETITVADIERARDILVERQDTHLDSLAERLRDPRVRAVIEPMIQGENLASMPPDDLQFVIDLGLVRETAEGGVEVANPIYREIIARQLTVTVRASLPKITPTWLDAEGRIDFAKLLDAFIEFWLRHGEALLGSSPYNEAAPHLVLMAFLQRVVNGGGRIDREYAIGAKRLDLCVEYRGEKLGIEVKTWRESDKAKDPTIEGLPQLDGYLARIGVGRGWLLLFDQRKKVIPLPERLKREHTTTEGGRKVELVRL